MMSTPIEQQAKFYLNQQTAELLVLRVTLQVLIWNIVRQEPQGAGILGLLRQEVLSSLDTTLAIPPEQQNRQEMEQIKQMSLTRAGKMFDDIAKTLEGAKPPTAPGTASSAG
jgi:hypothetical protein